jgi:hypothetical protein
VVVVAKWDEILGAGLFGSVAGPVRLAPVGWNFAFVVPIVLIAWPRVKSDVVMVAVAVATQAAGSVYIDFADGRTTFGDRAVGAAILLEIFAVGVGVTIWLVSSRATVTTAAVGLLFGVLGSGCLVSSFAATPATAVWVAGGIACVAVVIRARYEIGRASLAFTVLGCIAGAALTYAWSVVTGSI